MTSALETAQQESERWRRREHRLVDALDQVEEERVRLEEELGRVEQQILYYNNLTRDMKRELGRPGLSSLLSSLRKS